MESVIDSFCCDDTDRFWQQGIQCPLPSVRFELKSSGCIEVSHLCMRMHARIGAA